MAERHWYRWVKVSKKKSKQQIIDDLQIELADSQSRVIVLREKLAESERANAVARAEATALRGTLSDIRAHVKALHGVLG